MSGTVETNVFTLNKLYQLVVDGQVAYSDTGSNLWSWGYNFLGQLGDGTTVFKSSPVQIPGTSWNDIAGGCNHSMARKSDGTLWTWGLNNSGQLGDGTRTYRSSPVQVPGTSWNDIAGGYHSMARKTDGTLWTWGINSDGQLGDGTTTNMSSPVQIPGTSWNDIAGGSSRSMARKTN